jgi:hypothetical protein
LYAVLPSYPPSTAASSLYPETLSGSTACEDSSSALAELPRLNLLSLSATPRTTAPSGSTAHLSGITACVRAEGITVGFEAAYKRGFSSPLNLILLARVLPPLLTFFELAIS